MATFLPTETYAALVEALSNPVPAIDGSRRDAVILTLGEIGDVWPTSILPDALQGSYQSVEMIADS